MNRRRKLYLNTITALLLQLVTFICGFILPRYILGYFGSDVNGLVTSITRFLSFISFLEMGIGPVIQSNLYKPLADGDIDTTSKIAVSSEKFYRRIAHIFLAYIGVLFVVYPIINHEFDFIYTSSLLLIISISTFAQYYFGLTYQAILNADQKIYIVSAIQIITVILNTIICIVLMNLGLSVHIVKLASSLVFVIRPVFLNFYVRKHYNLNLKITYVTEPIKQKWNGFAQHIAAVVSEEIDVVLLTFFAGYQSVSIYSVYFLVVNGVTKIIMTTVSGLESFWGNMLAKREMESLQKTFNWVECCTHVVVTFLFGSASILIAPFVSVYIKGTDDAAAYYLPLFGAIITFAYGTQCLRVPYFRIIKAAGHYRQTQNGSFISTALNVLISLLLVVKLGIIGVSAGTLSAMAFHTIYLAWYLRKNILNIPFKRFVVHLLVDGVCCCLTFFLTKWFTMQAATYGFWILYAVEVSVVSLTITIAVNGLIYKSTFQELAKKIFKK